MKASLGDDHELWNALKHGDQQALSVLYQRYYSALYSYGYKICPSSAEVEDAIQDLFVSLWRYRESLSPIDSVKFYLFRSIRRNLHRMSEKQSRWSTDVPEFNSAQSQYSPELLLLEREHSEELILRLAEILQQLPQRQLEVVSLRFYENFKTHEIANIMGISEKSVRNTLHKALIHLRKYAHFLAPFLYSILFWLIL